MESTEKSKRLFAEFPPNSRSEWEDQISKDLKGADYEKKLIWKTYEGIAVKPYYSQEDLENLATMGSPAGAFPYIRGNRNHGNTWEIRQDIFTDEPLEANKYAVEAIRQGAEGIGFYIARTKEVEEMNKLFDNIDLEKTAVHFLNARHYPTLLDLFIKYLDFTGLDHNKIKGSLNYDPISYALLHGDFYRGRSKDFDEAPEMIRKAQKEIPGFRLININGQHFHQAGGDVVQEIACTLASGLAYLSELTDRGLGVDEITPHLQFTLAIGSNYFLEISKIRAIRMLWARIIEQYNPVNADSCKMYLHSTTSQWNKTLYDPYVNLLRTTTETMAAAIAGSEAITVSPFDLAYKAPDEFSYHIARNQQILLKEESWLDKVADPAAGSYYIESLTAQLADKTWALFQDIETKGGMIACIEEGFIQQMIARTAAQKEDDIASRKMVLLGTNQYPNQAEVMLDRINKPLQGPRPDNTATFETLKLSRASQSFEDLRLRTEKYIINGGRTPKVFLFNYGSLAYQKARATFSTNFFACAGFEIVDPDGFLTVDEGIAACVKERPAIIVFCSSDEEYADLLQKACPELRQQCVSSMLVLAGYPKDQLETFSKLGIKEFIHVRSNILQTLTTFQTKLGIL
ncbi:MAG: acyl-CoA mutase large subunit family protein [Bacteroidota bacterium]